MFEAISRYWAVLLVISGIGIFFIPMTMCLHLYRGHNRINVDSRLTFWIIPIKFSLYNPVTKTVWNISRNKPWKKKSPAELRAQDVNWLRMFSRVRLLNTIGSKIWEKANSFFKSISKRIRVTELNMYTEIGLADALQTAVSVGMIWSFLGILHCRMAELFNINSLKKEISVVPNYQTSGVLIADYTCIFEFRLGHIIIIMVQVLSNAAKIYTIVRRISR